MRKFVFIMLLFIALLVGGTTGYMVFEGFSFWDSIYLTAMTITTVGYGDIVPVNPPGKVFTIFLVFTGVGFVLYAFSRLADTMIMPEDILIVLGDHSQITELEKVV